MMGKLAGYQKRIFEILFIIIVSSIFMIPYLGNDIYVGAGHDLTYHLNRLIGLKDAIMEGQILPKIYPYANNGFGYASPLFYCDVFLIPFAFLEILGISTVISYKVMCFAITMFTAASVLFICRKVFHRKYLPYIAVIAYIFNGYYICDFYARSALGEVIALSFVPWVLYSIYKILVLKENCWVMLGVSFACLFMSHMISAYVYVLLFAIFIVIYLIFDRQEYKRVIITIIKGTITGLLLSAWFILPMFEQLISQEFYLNHVSEHFIIGNTVQNIADLLNPLMHIDVNGRNILNVISVGPLVILLPLLYFFVRKNVIVNVLLIVSVVALMMITGIIPIPFFLDILQFAFRLNIVILPLMLIVIIYILENLDISKSNIVTIVILCFTIFNVFNQFGDVLNSGTYYLNNQSTKNDINNITSYLYELDYNHDELGGAEYLPYTFNTDYINDSLEILTTNEDGEFVSSGIKYDRNYSSITFDYDGDRIDAILPMSYYKGYRAYKILDGIREDYSLYNMEVFKKIGLDLEGPGTYEIKYVGTKVQKISLLLSVSALIGLVVVKYPRRENV